MAKDGTYRGGRSIRAGDKPTSAAEKLSKEGRVRIMQNDIPDLEYAELKAVDLPQGAVLEEVDMPKPGDYLSARQKDGKPLGADMIYIKIISSIWNWHYRTLTGSDGKKTSVPILQMK